MEKPRCFWGLWTAAVFCVLLLFGCSSLPQETVQTSEIQSRVTSILKLGHKYYRTGQYEKAGACFEKALATQASIDDQAAVAKTLSSLGRTRLAQGELNTAEAHFKQAFQATRGLNRPELEAQALGGLGSVELHRQLPLEAINWLEMALELPLDDPGNTRATLLHDLGSAHQKLSDNHSAKSYFQLALGMHESLRNLAGIAGDCYCLAQLYKDEGNHALALQNARRALNHDKRAENPSGVAQDLTLLGSLSSTGGDHDQARNFYRRAKLAWQALGRTDQCHVITKRLQGIEKP